MFMISGHRSAIAYAILRRNGLDTVKNYSGDIKKWIANKGKI